jgi:hypothetical protein
MYVCMKGGPWPQNTHFVCQCLELLYLHIKMSYNSLQGFTRNWGHIHLNAQIGANWSLQCSVGHAIQIDPHRHLGIVSLCVFVCTQFSSPNCRQFTEPQCRTVNNTDSYLKRSRGRAMAQAVSPRPPTAEARFRSRVSPCGISGGQSGIGTGFSPEYFGFQLSISFHRCSITWKNEKH